MDQLAPNIADLLLWLYEKYLLDCSEKYKTIVLMNLNRFIIEDYFYSNQLVLNGKHTKRNSSLVLLAMTFLMLESFCFSFSFCKHSWQPR